MTAPPPLDSSYWGREVEYLINRLCDRLQIWKAFNCIVISLDGRHLRPQPSKNFRDCRAVGRFFLKEWARKRLHPKEKKKKGSLKDTDDEGRRRASPEKLHYLGEFSTPVLSELVLRECLSSENVSWIFKILRIPELMEGLRQPLTADQQRGVVLAILGELVLIRQQLRLLSQGELPTQQKEDAVKLIELLDATASQLSDMIYETGRDRAALQRQAHSCIPLHDMGRGFREDDAHLPCLIVPRRGPTHQGDDALSFLLQNGSVLSIWYTLCRLAKLGSPGLNQIRGSLLQTLPQLNRFRQIIFTRVLEALCTRTYTVGTSVKEAVVTRSPPFLLQTVASALVETAAAERPQYRYLGWPYESRSQLVAIEKATDLDLDTKKELRSILCVRDSLSLASTVGGLHGTVGADYIYGSFSSLGSVQLPFVQLSLPPVRRIIDPAPVSYEDAIRHAVEDLV